MRTTTLARKLLGVSRARVRKVTIEDEGVTIEVRLWNRVARCGGCGSRAPLYDRQRSRRWRHLAVGAVILWVRYAPRRVSCRECGVRCERVPWAASTESRFTAAFEEFAAYLARATDKTAVSKLLGIAWRTVGGIIERVVGRRLDAGRLDGLTHIGVDEFSYRKRHHYVTVVVDHVARRVVWAAEGKSGETLERFFDELGVERAARIECVTMDMSAAYLKVVQAQVPRAQVVFDRFHVQKLVSEALDQVRREQVRGVNEVGEKHAIKHSRFALLKNPWDLTRRESQKLAEVKGNNEPLYRAYLLKETLAQALSYAQPRRAKRALEEWLGWASRSRLKPFVRVGRTIRSHRERILAYIDYRLTNGLVEGINNKLRMIARRAYGFHGPEPLVAMLFLCCGGVQLNPPLPRRT